MAEKEQENQQDNTPKKVETSISGKVSVSYDPQPLADIVHAIRETNTTQTQEEEINNRQNRRQADAQERANTISSRLFWTNLFMLAVTICVFAWNIKGVAAATDAAKAAIKSDSIAEENYKLAKASFESSTQENRARFILDSTNTEKQINALKKQFQMENEPYVECNNFSIAQWEESKNLIITYSIVNVGNRPVQILENRVYYNILPAQPDSPFNDNAYIKQKFRIYKKFISKEAPAPSAFTSDSVIAPIWIKVVKSGLWQMYFWGEVKYINSLTGKHMVYRFMVRLYAPPSVQYSLITDENVRDKR